MNKLLGLAMILVAASGCASQEPATPEPEKVQAIKFVLQPAPSGTPQGRVDGEEAPETAKKSIR